MEKPIVECKRHWSMLVWPCIIGIFLLSPCMSLFADGETGAGILGVIIVACIIAPAFIKWKTDFLRLSATQITGKTGFIKTTKQVSPISKIQDITVSSGLFGKIFGYSTILVSTAGGGGIEYKYKNMTNGELLQKKVVEIEACKK